MDMGGRSWRTTVRSGSWSCTRRAGIPIPLPRPSGCTSRHWPGLRRRIPRRWAYGYLLECHGRYALRQAVAQYERAIELDPDADKPHYQHIWAQAALRDTEPAIALYSQRLARSPTDVREHRFLANAYLAARHYQEAARVVDAGLALVPDDPMLLDVRATRGPRPGTRTGHWPTGAARSRSTRRTLARSTAAHCCSSVWDGSRRPQPSGSPSSPGATRTRPR